MTHVRTGAYFSSLLAALAVILRLYPWAAVWAKRPLGLPLAAAYSLAALAATWRLILIFFVQHTRQYATHADPPNLFVDAYRLVCDDPAGWVWSCMLLSWVCVACLHVEIEGRRRRLPPALLLCFMMAAFLGAVSLAFPLLLLLLATPVSPPVHGGGIFLHNTFLWPMCLFLALASTALLPLTVSGPKGAFISALVILHLILILPFAYNLVPSSVSVQQQASSSFVRRLYLTLACVCLPLHLGSLVVAFQHSQQGFFSPSIPSAVTKAQLSAMLWHLVSATWRNTCQASISIDAVLASLSGACYMLNRGGSKALIYVVASPLVSPGAALALFAAARGDAIQHEWSLGQLARTKRR